MKRAEFSHKISQTSSSNKQNFHPSLKSLFQFYSNNYQHSPHKKYQYPLTETQQDKLSIQIKQTQDTEQVLTEIKHQQNSQNIYKSNNYSSCTDIKNSRKSCVWDQKKLKTLSHINLLLNKKNTKPMQTQQNPSKQLIKTLKPIRSNNEITLNTLSQNTTKITNINNNTSSQVIIKKQLKKQSNFDKLKKLILQLDRQDFISQQNNQYLNYDPIQNNQNCKNNKYHLIIPQKKNKGWTKLSFLPPKTAMLVRSVCNENTKAVIGISRNFTAQKKKILSNFMGVSSRTFAARRYFSKPKTRQLELYQQGNKGERKNKTGSHPKIRTINENMGIGLNLFRGKIHQKKDSIVDKQSHN